MCYFQVQDTDEYALMCGKCIGVLNEFHDMYSLVNIILHPKRPIETKVTLY